MAAPVRDGPPPTAQSGGASLKDYLKEAFLFRWNLLFFLGGVAGAALTPLPGVLLPLVAAGELTYLAGLIRMPRFRAAIDAKVHGQGRQKAEAVPARTAAVAGRHARRPAGRCPPALRAACMRVVWRCARSPSAFAAPPAMPSAPKKSARQDSIGCSGCSFDCSSRKPRSTGSWRR